MVRVIALAALLLFSLSHGPLCWGSPTEKNNRQSPPGKAAAPPREGQEPAVTPLPSQRTSEAAGGLSASPNAAAARNLTVHGKVTSLDGEALAGATVWLTSFSSLSHRLAETRTNGSGDFSLEVELGTGSPEALAFVLGASHPECVEAREVLELNGSADVAPTTLLLRKPTETLEEPSLDLLDAWLLPRLSLPPSYHQNPAASRKKFEAALARYRRQPGDKTALEQVWQATREAEFPEARWLAALALMRLGAWASAERALASTAAASPGPPETFLIQGMRWNLLRRPEEAAQALQQALQGLPANGLVELELGRAALLGEDWPTAEEKLGAALAHRAPAGEARYLRARALAAQGQLEAATFEVKALEKSMGRKRLPPAVQSLFADLQERLEERSLTPINSVMDQPIPELVQTVPALKGLDVASPPPPGGLPGILKWAGAMVDKFFRDFTNTAATEILRQTRLTKNGKPKEARSEQFYYVFINRSEQGHSWMEEFRANQQGQQIVPGGLEKGFMATSGFATSLVVLHPKWQPSLDYRFLGRQPVSGHPAYVLGFAQRPEVSPALGAFRLGQQKVVPLHMQGIAWISADRHQVLHLRTDLLEPVPKIGLTRETTEIDYRPHRFASSPQPFWLPSRVTVSVDWGGKRLCNEHIFSKFRLFKVEVETEQAGATHDVAGATGKPSSN